MIGEPEAPTMTPLLSQMEEKPVDIVAVHLDSRNKRIQPGA
jgi:hypothetical protein